MVVFKLVLTSYLSPSAFKWTGSFFIFKKIHSPTIIVWHFCLFTICSKHKWTNENVLLIGTGRCFFLFFGNFVSIINFLIVFHNYCGNCGILSWIFSKSRIFNWRQLQSLHRFVVIFQWYYLRLDLNYAINEFNFVFIC